MYTIFQLKNNKIYESVLLGLQCFERFEYMKAPSIAWIGCNDSRQDLH